MSPDKCGKLDLVRVARSLGLDEHLGLGLGPFKGCSFHFNSKSLAYIIVKLGKNSKHSSTPVLWGRNRTYHWLPIRPQSKHQNQQMFYISQLSLFFRKEDFDGIGNLTNPPLARKKVTSLNILCFWLFAWLAFFQERDWYERKAAPV